MNPTNIEWAELLEASKQMRDACACACRVISQSQRATEMFGDELEKAYIEKGFGKRLDDAIKVVEK